MTDSDPIPCPPPAETRHAPPETVVQTATCLFCGGSRTALLYPCTDMNGRSRQVRRCDDCEARFLSPRPTEAELTEAYDLSYYGPGEKKFSSPVEKVLNRFRHGRARALARRLPRGARVLDVGCGNGGFLRSLHDLGEFELHGVELPGPAAERTARFPFIRLKVGTLEEHDFPPASLDAITLFHVFEHLPHPAAALDMIVRFLRPGGFLVMSFPNIGSLQSRLFKGKWLHLDPPRHLFFLPPAAFRAQVGNRGLEVLGERQLSFEQNPLGFQQSLLNLCQNRRDVLFEAMKGNRMYAGQASRASLALQKVFFLATFPLFALSDVLESALGAGATVQFVLRKKS